MKNTLAMLTITTTIGIFLFSCTKTPTDTTTQSEESNQFPDLAAVEQTLSDLAELLPKALTDLGLAKIVWDEAKANEEDEAYAIWLEIADVQTPSELTLKSELQRIMLTRNLRKTMAESEDYTSSFSNIERLQIYIYNFELWDGESSLLAAFEPVTRNDIDVEWLTLYNVEGGTTKIDAINPPDYSLIVVGINERQGYYEGEDSSRLHKTVAARTEIMDKMYLTDDHEPWWKGKAEIYIVSAGTKGAYDEKLLVDLTNVNHSGSWYGTDYNLFEWDKTYWGDYVGFGVIEQDGCCRDWNVDIEIENYRVKVSKSGNDDFVGRIKSVSYNHPNNHQFNFDDVRMVLKY